MRKVFHGFSSGGSGEGRILRYMKWIKDVLRKVILGSMRWSGFFHLWRYFHRHQVIFLTAHGTGGSIQEGTWTPLRPQHTAEGLETSLKLLSRYYRFISVEVAVEMIAGRMPVQSYCLAVTFDDGYRNNLGHAIPVLRRYGVQPAIFLATGNVEERKPFWFDRLDYALQKADIQGREISVAGTQFRFEEEGKEALRIFYKRLRDIAKSMKRDDWEMIREQEELARKLESGVGKRLSDIFEEDGWSAVMTWEEARKASMEGICIGSHSVDHIRLGAVGRNEAIDQMVKSKAMIEERIGFPCRYLAYPNGSFTREVVVLCRECGYEAAFTTTEGANSVGDCLYTLNRIHLPVNAKDTELLAKVAGLSDLVALAKKMLGIEEKGQSTEDWS
jgi:peptidoglycan/xylan/chitin deacetylase (PgdA/CDA1 family)